MNSLKKGTAFALALLLPGCNLSGSTGSVSSEMIFSTVLPSRSQTENVPLPMPERSAESSSPAPAVHTGLIREQVLESAEGPIHYSFYLPEGYDGEKSFPLVVTMPGYDRMWFGEDSSGSNLTWNGFTAWTELDEDLIVVSVQLTDWGETSAKQAVCLTEYFIEHFAADRSRVYAAGYSAGEETMSRAVALRPDLYAAYLHGGSQWDGDYQPVAAEKVAVYIFFRKVWLPQKHGNVTMPLLKHGFAERSDLMEIRVLRYFLTVVREESITKAAEVLHITQPTLSRQLSQMEAEIGVRLFDRGSRKITLTNEGLLLRRRAEEILQLVDKTEKELVEQEEQVEGKITIGCGEIASVGQLPPLISAFHERHPLVTFDLYTATADHVKEQMDRGLVDIGLLLEPIDIEKYDFIRLTTRERWVVLMRPDDPLAEKEAVTAGELSKRTLILPRRMKVQGELASWFGDYYGGLSVLFTSNLSTNAAVMVSQRLGLAIVIEGAVPFWDQEKIAHRPLSPALTATSVLAWKRGQPFSPAATRLIAHIKCFLGMTIS